MTEGCSGAARTKKDGPEGSSSDCYAAGVKAKAESKAKAAGPSLEPVANAESETVPAETETVHKIESGPPVKGNVDGKLRNLHLNSDHTYNTQAKGRRLSAIVNADLGAGAGVETEHSALSEVEIVQSGKAETAVSPESEVTLDKIGSCNIVLI